MQILQRGLQWTPDSKIYIPEKYKTFEGVDLPFIPPAPDETHDFYMCKERDVIVRWVLYARSSAITQEELEHDSLIGAFQHYLSSVGGFITARRTVYLENVGTYAIEFIYVIPDQHSEGYEIAYQRNLYGGLTRDEYIARREAQKEYKRRMQIREEDYYSWRWNPQKHREKMQRKAERKRERARRRRERRNGWF